MKQLFQSEGVNMSVNKEDFTKVDAPEFLILETVDNNIEHLKNEIKRLEKLKQELRYELEYGNGWSFGIYELLNRL